MKKGLIIFGIFLLFTLFSMFNIHALPTNFEINNVYWAFNGTVLDSSGNNVPILFGFLNVSWKNSEGITFNGPIAYMNFNGQPLFRSGSVWGSNFLEMDFLPLDLFSSAPYSTEISSYSIGISTDATGKIISENIQFSKVNKEISQSELNLFGSSNHSTYNVVAKEEYKYDYKIPGSKIFQCGKFLTSDDSGNIIHTKIVCTNDCFYQLFPTNFPEKALDVFGSKDISYFFEGQNINSFCSKYQGVKINSMTSLTFNMEEFRNLVNGGI